MSRYYRPMTATALCLGLATAPAFAGQTDALKAQIEALKQQIAAQQEAIKALEAQVDDLKVQTTAEATEQRRVAAEAPKLQLKDARPTFESGDGKSSVSLRGRLSLDMAKYIQDKAGPQASDFR